MTYMDGTQYGQQCHISPAPVMKIGKVDVYAGGWFAMEGHLDWGLRMRLNDGFTLRHGSFPLVALKNGAEKILPRMQEINYPPTLDIDWEDFGTPSLDQAWWVSLVEQLETIKEPMTMAVYCHGGHGRTGTALAILASLSGNVPDDYDYDCVEWVRENYCEEAVEAYSQIDYIANITGEVIDSKPTSYLKMQAKQGNNPGMPTYKHVNGKWETTWENPNNVTRIDGTGQPYAYENDDDDIAYDPGNSVQSSNAKAIMQHLNKKGSKRK